MSCYTLVLLGRLQCIDIFTDIYFLVVVKVPIDVFGKIGFPEINIGLRVSV